LIEGDQSGRPIDSAHTLNGAARYHSPSSAKTHRRASCGLGPARVESAMPEKSKAILSLGSQTMEFHRANEILDDLIHQLRSSPADTGQLICELCAGREYIKAPEVRRDFIKELLIKPLKKLDGAAPTERIRVAANEYLNWLLPKL
jgi:hypothetical protein